MYCSVKPAVFDLFLAIAVIAYLATFYLTVKVCDIYIPIFYGYMFNFIIE